MDVVPQSGIRAPIQDSDPQPGAPTRIPIDIMTDFEGVVPALGQALLQRGYTDLTPVQTAVLAPELADADALVSAQTGSGKTVAFGLALAPTLLGEEERFGASGAPMALTVAPTRELALQVKRELEWLYAMTGASVASCVGGMDMRTERRALQRGAHIVVGTPGRLRDHIDRGSLNTANLKAVVLDEADEMLDLGFREDLEYILDAAPEERRTLMFSATVPRSIATLAKRYQRDAVRVTTQAEQKQHVDIEYRALTVAPNDRENAIVNVLRYFEAKNALVFCSTRATVNHMTARFANRGFSVVALSGELNQNERTHALQALRDGRARVCVATDVAARGLDLPNLELVVHADLPTNSDTLLHRSGRTGRAGRKGVSAMIVPHSQRRRTERLLQNARITATWAKPPSADDVNRRDDERLLADPALSDPLQEEEQAFVTELLSTHGAEQVAAAFVRLYKAGRSAPEELLDVAVPEPAKAKRRDDFQNGVWFSLSVGRKQNAEARWLLPMLCRAGDITKNAIGAIRIQQDATYVELEPGSVAQFLQAIGQDRTIEKTINVKQVDGPPDGSADRSPAPERRQGRRDDKRAAHRDEKRSGGQRSGYRRDDRPGPEAKRKVRRERDTDVGGDVQHEKSNRETPAHDGRRASQASREPSPSRRGAQAQGDAAMANATDNQTTDPRAKGWLKRKDSPKSESAGQQENPSGTRLETGGKSDPGSAGSASRSTVNLDPNVRSQKRSKRGAKRTFDPISADTGADFQVDGKTGGRPKAKKPPATKFSKAKSTGSGAKSGSAPLKRKKSKKKPAN